MRAAVQCKDYLASKLQVRMDDGRSRRVHGPRIVGSAFAVVRTMLRQQLLDTGRGRIVSLLQRGPLTVDDIASKLELSASGVRAQITAMERDGVVRRVGRRPGTTRPSRVFELTPEVEQLLSRAYIPLLTQLVDVFANGPAGASGGCVAARGGKEARRSTVFRTPVRPATGPSHVPRASC